jgi:hypothetical protein
MVRAPIGSFKMGEVSKFQVFSIERRLRGHIRQQRAVIVPIAVHHLALRIDTIVAQLSLAGAVHAECPLPVISPPGGRHSLVQFCAETG